MNIKKAVIFGDSYSTYKGYIPEGYAVYYDDNDTREDTDVRKVTETWWHRFITETGIELVLNNSWSGSTIGYTGYENTDCSESSSFIFRFEQLVKEDFFKKNDIDTVFVFGGTNDSWCNAPLGELKFSDWQDGELYSVLPAIGWFFKRLNDELQGVNIVCIINTELKDEISGALKAACEHFGCHAIVLHDVDKCCGHPTIKGMNDIKEQILSYINNI